MFVYHLDRSKTLKAGQDIRLSPKSELPPDLADSEFIAQFDGGISLHGMQYLDLSCTKHPYFVGQNGNILFDHFTISAQLNIADMRILEYGVELVRRAHFPQYPSRYQSLFAVRETKDLQLWPELITQSDIQPSHIFQIETHNKTDCFDANWLRGGLIHNISGDKYYLAYAPTLCFDLAFKYWSKVASDLPRWEYLLPLPIDADRIRQLPTLP